MGMGEREMKIRNKLKLKKKFDSVLYYISLGSLSRANVVSLKKIFFKYYFTFQLFYMILHSQLLQFYTVFESLATCFTMLLGKFDFTVIQVKLTWKDLHKDRGFESRPYKAEKYQ